MLELEAGCIDEARVILRERKFCFLYREQCSSPILSTLGFSPIFACWKRLQCAFPGWFEL